MFMAERSEGEHIVTLNGLYNGRPHTIDVDTLRQVREQAARNGEVLSDNELHRRADEMLTDLKRWTETIDRQPVPLKGILGRIVRRSQ